MNQEPEIWVDLQAFFVYIRSPIAGGLVLIGKAAVLKTAGRKPLGVRVPRPPLT